MTGAFTLLPYQARWVRDESPVKLCVKSRRIGLSWTEAYDDVLAAARTGGASTFYVGTEAKMTRGWVGDCRDWAERLHRLALHVDEEVFDEGGQRLAQFRLRFPSGAVIEGLPSTAHALRGRGRPGERAVLDEAAFQRRGDDVLASALALQIWGGRVRILSTHNGAESAFARLIEEVRAGERPYSLHEIDFRTALADGLYRRVLAVEAAAARAADPGADLAAFAWSPDREQEWEARIRASYRWPWQAAEELDCVPAPGAGAWIPLEDYLAAEHPDAGVPRPPDTVGGPVFVGYDVARRRDLAVISALERAGGVLWLREMVVMDNERFDAQRDEVARMCRDHRAVRVAVDQIGMGEVQVEELEKRLGARRVVGVQLTSGRRIDAAAALRDAFESRSIRIPRDQALRSDVRSVRRAPGGSPDRPRLWSDERETDGHADRFWSLALAALVAGAGDPRYAAHRVDNHRDPSGDPGVLPGRRDRRWRMRAQPGALA